MSTRTILPKGVFTATLTPMNQDLSVNHDLLLSHCVQLMNDGSDGITLLGTTGEANSFSVAERKEILDRLIEGGMEASRLLVGTGCCALPDTIELTGHAMHHRVGGVLVLPPFYYKQVSDSGLLRYFELLLDKVNDPGLRVILYHFPKMSGVSFSLPLIKELIARYPGQIIGIKDSTGDFEHMKSIQTAIPGFRVYAGTEKLLLDIIKIGGAGCISATANVTASLAAKVYQAWKNGEDPSAIDTMLKSVRSSFDGLPFTGALKCFLHEKTTHKDWRNIRPPNELISDQQLNELKAKVASLWV